MQNDNDFQQRVAIPLLKAVRMRILLRLIGRRSDRHDDFSIFSAEGNTVFYDSCYTGLIKLRIIMHVFDLSDGIRSKLYEFCRGTFLFGFQFNENTGQVLLQWNQADIKAAVTGFTIGGYNLSCKAAAFPE